MKKIIFAVTLLLGVGNVSAQTFAKGTLVIQGGVGLGSDIGLPIGLFYEYGISDKLGAGVYAGYASKTETLPFFGDLKHTYTLFGARGNYHSFQSDKMDTYVGILIGYNAASLTVSNTPAGLQTPVAASAMVFGGHVGGRYYFSDSLAAFGEIGYGLGYLNLGLAYKL